MELELCFHIRWALLLFRARTRSLFLFFLLLQNTLLWTLTLDSIFEAYLSLFCVKSGFICLPSEVIIYAGSLLVAAQLPRDHLAEQKRDTRCWVTGNKSISPWIMIMFLLCRVSACHCFPNHEQLVNTRERDTTEDDLHCTATSSLPWCAFNDQQPVMDSSIGFKCIKYSDQSRGGGGWRQIAPKWCYSTKVHSINYCHQFAVSVCPWIDHCRWRRGQNRICPHTRLKCKCANSSDQIMS